MFGRIVVGWDGSDPARDALALARMLRADDGTILAACVHGRLAGSAGQARNDAMRDVAEETLRGALAEATERWLETRAVAGLSASHGLHGVVEQEDADLVVVGSARDAGSGHVSAGSTGQRLLNGSPCPVAVAPAGYRDRAAWTPRVLGVAYDGGEEAERAVSTVTALAGQLGSAIKLVTVVPPLQVWLGDASFAPFPGDEEIERGRRDEYERRLGEAVARVPDAVPVEGVLREGEPADQIVDAVREGIDFLAMGSRNYGPLRRVMVGSTAIELIQRAPCPVMVVPRGAA